jgi:hypothetical protein
MEAGAAGRGEIFTMPDLAGALRIVCVVRILELFIIDARRAAREQRVHRLKGYSAAAAAFKSG